MKRKLITSFVLMCLVTTVLTPSIVFASTNGQNNEITTRKELVNTIEKYSNDGELSNYEQKSINNNTSDQLLKQFSAEKETLAEEILTTQKISATMEEQADGSLYGKKRIDLGDGCYIDMICKDDIDSASVNNISCIISSLFSTTAYAKEKKKVVTKKYGDRMYSVKFTVYIGGGAANLYLENHYKLSSSGITERYGYSSASSTGLGTNVSEYEPVITDKYATKPGKSNTNMYCKYSYSSSIGAVNTNGVRTINSILTYKSINKRNKTITLEQKSIV